VNTPSFLTTVSLCSFLALPCRRRTAVPLPVSVLQR
jgi:hypothetical protein